MNDKNNDTPENGAVEAPQEVSKKPTPPLPPPPGEEPPAPPPVERAPLPAYEPGPSPPKSPGLAAFLGVICPGAGYLYVWAYERAFMLWAAIALSIFMIIEGLWGFSFVIAFAYFFSIFDAFREAQFYNARAEGDELPKTRPDGQGRLMFGVFMVVVAAVFLADKYLNLDMSWILEWWPVPVFLLGVYFIIAAVRDKMKARERERSGAETDQF
jgi:hypothetical protein